MNNNYESDVTKIWENIVRVTLYLEGLLDDIQVLRNHFYFYI